MPSYSVLSQIQDTITAHSDGWRALIFLVVTVASALYLVRLWALPKPIPGIPHRHDVTRHILGDIPAMLKATANTDQTYMQWIQQEMSVLDSPIIQMFIRPLSRPVLILADFRETQDILMRRKEWDRSDMLGDLLGGLLPGHHLHQPTNPVWKAHRRLLQDLMSPSFLHDVAAPAVYNSASVLISLWEAKARMAGNRPFSAHNDIYTVALDGVQAFAFGEEFEYNATRPNLEILEGLDAQAITRLSGAGAAKNEDEPVEFPEAKPHDVVTATLDLTEAVGKVQGSPLMRLTWKLMELTPHLRRARKIKDAYILRELKRAVDHMRVLHEQSQSRVGDSGPRVRSAVDHMVQRENQLAQKDGREPEYFSPIMMVETFGFVIGGHDTTSTTILWGLKNLADNQVPQTQLRSILQDSFSAAKSENRNPSVGEITGTSIPYLDAVIEEIFRQSGTSPAVDRQTTTDTQVLGYHVPKGTIMLMLTQGPSLRSSAFKIDETRRSQSCQAAKQDGRYRTEWDPLDIDLFKPERWLVPASSTSMLGETEKRDLEYQFDGGAGPMLSFGLGMRGCFGRKLGYLELRILITLIVWNFELLPCSKDLSGYGCKMGVTTKPKDCYVRLRKVDLGRD